jgi:hypothetical protein
MNIFYNKRSVRAAQCCEYKKNSVVHFKMVCFMENCMSVKLLQKKEGRKEGERNGGKQEGGRPLPWAYKPKTLIKGI